MNAYMTSNLVPAISGGFCTDHLGQRREAMKRVDAYNIRKLLHQPIVVTHSEVLADLSKTDEGQEMAQGTSSISSRSALQPKPPSRGEIYYVPNKFVLNHPELTSPRKFSVFAEVNASRSPEQEKPHTNVVQKGLSLKDMVAQVGSGGALATPVLSVIPLGNTVTETQLAGQMMNWGFSPSASSSMASAALEFARSTTGKLTCLFVGGTAISLGAIEAIKPQWSWRRKLTVACAIGTVIVVIAIVLVYLGIWGHSPEKTQNGKHTIQVEKTIAQ